MQIWAPRPESRDDGEFAVHLNPGQGEPFVVIELSEDRQTALIIQSIGECDRLLAAVTRAKSLLNTAPPAQGAS